MMYIHDEQTHTHTQIKHTFCTVCDNRSDFHLLRPLWLESVMFGWRSAITWRDNVYIEETMEEIWKVYDRKYPQRVYVVLLLLVVMLLLLLCRRIYAFWSNFIKRTKHLQTLTYKYVSSKKSQRMGSFNELSASFSLSLSLTRLSLSLSSFVLRLFKHLDRIVSYFLYFFFVSSSFSEE